MKKYEGNSIRKVTTDCGKIPQSVGHSKVSGVTRKLTKKEQAAQKRIMNHGS